MGFLNYLKNFGIVGVSFFGALFLWLLGIVYMMESTLIGGVVIAIGFVLLLYGYYRREQWQKRRRRSPPRV